MNDLIQSKESVRYPGLFVQKYRKKVFFKNLWSESDDLLEARGHVVNSRGDVVIRPFTKVFNYGENNTAIDRDEAVIWVQKINGFMACATYVPEVNDIVVSTTGSLDSDFVAMAKEYITDLVQKIIMQRYYSTPAIETFMFEIVHPDDPHIIPEKVGAYLLGCRRIDDEGHYFTTEFHERFLDYLASSWMGVHRPDWGVSRFSDIVQESKTAKHEGFVVYGQYSNTVLKIKSKYYLTLKAAARKKDIETLDKSKVDEEFYDLIDYIKLNSTYYNSLIEQERLEFMRDYLENK